MFDLVRDPMELSNCAGSSELAQIEHRLRSELTEWRDALDDPADEFWQQIK